MTGIDFNGILSWLASAFSPTFGSQFPIGIAVEVFVLYLCFRSGAGLLLSTSALFVLTFILASMGYLPAVAYIFLVIVAAAALGYLVFIKPTK